ncbi:MAG: thioredoxin family protein [Halobacteriota archaeon]
MRFVSRFMAVITVLAVFFVIASSSLAVSVKAQNEIAWVYDYPTGMKAAAEENKPVMIYIHEDWCPRCRNMDQNTWNDGGVIQLSSNFVNINVVGTEQGTLYNYSKPPLIVFTDPQGRVIVKQNAELSASQVIALQRQVLAQAPLSSSSATGNLLTTSTPTTKATAINSSVSAKAAGVPGFEAIPSIVGTLIAALVLSRIGKSQR